MLNRHMSDTSSDDDMNWEEVVPFQLATHSIVVQPPAESAPLQITIRAPPSSDKQAEAQARREEAQAKSLQRLIRLQAHRFHTIALLANACIRNQWANDELLHVGLHTENMVKLLMKLSGATNVHDSFVSTNLLLNDYPATSA